MKLYEIEQAFLNLENMDLDEQTFNDTLENLEYEFEYKADNIACLVKSLIAESVAIELEARQNLLRAKAKQERAEKLKEYLFTTFKRLNKDKLETSRNVLKIKKNPLSVQLDDNFNNENYMLSKTILQINKLKIKEDLQNGTIIDGAKLIQNERLDIK